MTKRTPFAWRNLTHRKVRAVVALSGVCFSVLLVFMQAGFHAAVLAAATAVYRKMDADIFLISPVYVFLGRTGTIPRERLLQARSIAGVESVTEFFADIQLWRNPDTRVRHPMLIMGFKPTANLLLLPEDTMRLVENGDILVDSITQPYYGPRNPGTVTEIGVRKVRVVGNYRIGPGFATPGAAITDDDTFVRLFANRSRSARGS